jgi:hypothetical protein
MELRAPFFSRSLQRGWETTGIISMANNLAESAVAAGFPFTAFPLMVLRKKHSRRG